MIVITMITRHTTTITAPTAIPTSLAQLQEHMAVSAVPALSESDSKEGKKLIDIHASSSTQSKRHQNSMIILPIPILCRYTTMSYKSMGQEFLYY